MGSAQVLLALTLDFRSLDSGLTIVLFCCVKKMQHFVPVHVNDIFHFWLQQEPKEWRCPCFFECVWYYAQETWHKNNKHLTWHFTCRFNIYTKHLDKQCKAESVQGWWYFGSNINLDKKLLNAIAMLNLSWLSQSIMLVVSWIVSHVRNGGFEIFTHFHSFYLLLNVFLNLQFALGQEKYTKWGPDPIKLRQEKEWRESV